MLIDRYPAKGGPLTHRECIASSDPSTKGRASIAGPRVQARRYHRDGPYVLCGQVVALNAGDRELFKIETEIDTFWADGRGLRMCSGDGRCTCEPAPISQLVHGDIALSTTSATAQKPQQPCGFQRGYGAEAASRATR